MEPLIVSHEFDFTGITDKIIVLQVAIQAVLKSIIYAIGLFMQ